MTELKRYKVSVFGEHYTLITDEEEQKFFKSVEYVDALMRTIAQKSNNSDPKKIAILTALHIALNLKELERSYEQNRSSLQKLASLLESSMSAQ